MNENKEIDKGLSEFISSTFVQRTGKIAEIIVDFFEGDPLKPIRLIGFQTDASYSDFEILEDGYYYYNELKINIFESKADRNEI